MLLQFNFSNFKSYKNPVSLDMTATSIKEHAYNLITTANGEQYVKVAAIYGANASGKTAIIDAFEFMQEFVLYSFKREREGKGIPVKRFAFDKSSKIGKSEFEVFFTHKEKEYQYGFTLDNKKVYEEWLYRRDFRGKNKFNTLFERNNDKIECSNSMANAKMLTNLVEESSLFLSFISNAKIKEAKDVYGWFFNTEVLDFGNALMEGFISRFLPFEELKEEIYLKRFEDFLRAVDVGIEGIRIEEIKDIADEDEERSYKIYTKHKTLDGNGYMEIPLSEESSGTQKMFCLYHFLVDALTNGNTLFIDELDAKLHPLLLRYLINMFHDPEINKNNAQLIYSTHDNYTLTKETFRRDQIWFSEKAENGVSSLYSLAEYKLDNKKKVRNDATFNKDYLLGRYGAVPLLKEFNIDGV
ncbi:MAG: transporter [Peptococcaceae bacterium BICA1-8]|nr:MAG: transporter [Peptococcaceae bacterium BICA1-8]